MGASSPSEPTGPAPFGLSRSASQAKPLVPSATRLTAMETETLTAWRDCYVGYGFGFRTVAEKCATPPHLIRRAVRALARKGMVEYARSLFWEDEDKMGAGYTLTETGQAALNAMELDDDC